MVGGNGSGSQCSSVSVIVSVVVNSQCNSVSGVVSV